MKRKEIESAIEEATKAKNFAEVARLSALKPDDAGIEGSEKIDLKDVKPSATSPVKGEEFIVRVTRFDERVISDGKFGPWDRIRFFGKGLTDKAEALYQLNSSVFASAVQTLEKPLTEMTGLLIERPANSGKFSFKEV